MLAWRVLEKVLEVSIVQAVVRRDVVGVPFLVVLRRTLLAAEHPESGIVYFVFISGQHGSRLSAKHWLEDKHQLLVFPVSVFVFFSSCWLLTWLFIILRLTLEGFSTTYNTTTTTAVEFFYLLASKLLTKNWVKVLLLLLLYYSLLLLPYCYINTIVQFFFFVPFLQTFGKNKK